MTLRASTVPWQPRVRNSKLPLALTVVAGVLVALIAASYLAGYIFLMLIRADPRTATPLTLVRYGYYYGGREDIRIRLWVSAGAGLALVVTPGLALLFPKRRALHGEGRFARRGEIARAGLFAPAGIILGRFGGWGGFGGRLIVLGGQTGVALTAQPGAGKGVGVVVPNLLTWRGSVVCTDPKIENYPITAGFRRAMGQQVYLFNPLSPEGRTARWNPLDYVSAAPGQRVSDLQLIAHMFFPDPPGADPFWAAGGRSLFLGIALYLFDTPSFPRTIGEILRQGMANDEEGFAAHWKRVIQGRMSGNRPLSDTCVRALYDVIDLAPQTASSIRKTFTSRLELWANPMLDAATAASDFDLRELRKRPMSIYLGVMPKDLDRLAPLISLFFQQAIALQTDELPEHNPKLRYQVLMVMDEFPAFGRIPILTKSSGFLRGFNVRLLLIMQALSQIRDNYGENGAKTLLKTLAVRIFFAPKDMEDATEISNELGVTTVKSKSVSTPALNLFASKGHRHRSVSTSDQKRALMLPQEVKEIGADREIVFVENVHPIFCKKLCYYRMPMFLRLLRSAPPVPRVPPIELDRSSRNRPGDPDIAPEEAAQKTQRTRAATAEDIERIDELTLEDFAVDFSKVILPEKAPGERMTAQEMDTAVESFIAGLKDSR
jgi:type IV secretion system protein VirD4